MGETRRALAAARWVVRAFAAISFVFSTPSGAVQATVRDSCGNVLSGDNATASVDGATGNITLSGLTPLQSSPYVAMLGCGSPPPIVPDCSLSASTIRTLATNGSAVTLYAKCTSSPTTWNWIVPSNSPALPSAPSATISFTAPGAYTYAVAASNASGSGLVSNLVTILVADASTPPICSLTASPVAITANGQARLQATCNPAPASYAWTADPGAPLPQDPTSSGAVLTFSTAGTFVYKVQGVGVSNGPMATAAVTVNPGVGFVNGSFELPVMAPNSYTYSFPAGYGWTLTGASVGMITTGFMLSQGYPAAPDGSQIAFFSTNGVLQQTVTLTPGTYHVTFRATSNTNNVGIVVRANVNNHLIASGTPPGAQWALYTSQQFTVPSTAPYVFTFTTDTVSGYVYIDDIRLISP